MGHEPNFNKDDVVSVAEALLEVAVQEEHQGDSGRHEFLYFCRCCHNSSPERENLEHDLDCEVLIAQDLLTGS